MKYTFALVILVAALLVGRVFFLRSKSPLTTEAQTPAKTPVTHEEPPLNSPRKPLSPTVMAGAVASLKKMTTVLFQYTSAEERLEDLVDDLKSSGQDPFLVRDKNKHTGEMIIVRTKSPLPGTRYFHAQYFTDEAQHTFAQHMSFEFRPSPEAMNQAIQTVQEAFPNLDPPTDESRDFIQWDLDHGYVVWIKRLGPADIQGNPFNSYSEDDIGSIRIAIELAPEGH
jgi:hypothetical protein